MLSWGCRRFRAQFSPAEPELPEVTRAHRGRCAECHDYATALERAAAVRLPLPESLRAELSSLPAALAGGLVTGAGGRIPLAQLPLPAALRFRLQGIARPAQREKPPEWIASPRYAIAASLLLTVLSAALLGSPAELGAHTASFVGREVAPPLVQAREKGREELHALQVTAASRYGEIRGELNASVHDLHSRISTLTQFAGRLLPARRKP